MVDWNARVIMRSGFLAEDTSDRSQAGKYVRIIRAASRQIVGDSNHIGRAIIYALHTENDKIDSRGADGAVMSCATRIGSMLNNIFYIL